MNELKISKEWSMPNSETFKMKPVRDFILKKTIKLPKNAVIIDPYARNKPMAEYFTDFKYITNDLDETCPTDYHLDSQEFLETFEDNSVDFILFDPPYSSRQLSESYTKLEKSVTFQDTQSSFWAKQKQEIARILKPTGACITFGWNSGGIGKSLDFEQKEILLVAHGGWHNDTICTYEEKTEKNTLF